ncbi:MAG: ATP-binding cassette domain-containing protein [Actinobacteria bacterium]|nr:ATP-binding cassette domain-containing protein [Actinomycetota bacterium]
MAGVSFAGVRKEYAGTVALRELDLEIADGELLVLVGPSGSGKSTALRLVAGLEEATAGTISIGERDVTRLAPAKRNVSMVFQSYALFPHLTVGENIGFGLRARRVPRAEANSRIAVAAAIAGCSELLARRPFQLSGGERQRVALARAVVREPDVFLLDEPLSNLDAQLRVQTRAELKQLHARLGTTIVYVTHDQVEALTLGDRLAVLHDGVVQQIGSADDIYRRPANRFVATFVGSPAMNVLPVRLEGAVLRAGPFELDRPDIDERPLELGVRPEHIEVVAGEVGGQAEVQVVELAGNDTFLHLLAEGQRLVARVAPDLRPAVGSTVHVRSSPGRAYLFDADSGRTLAQGV